MSKLPKHNRYRPDFMAPGPHVQIEKMEGITFNDIQEPEDLGDEDEERASHKFYESKKILGKLYRAIDERKVFEEMQYNARLAKMDNPWGSSVLGNVWRFVQEQVSPATDIHWSDHLEWARDVREE
jgi:hypothetical protein